MLEAYHSLTNYSEDLWYIPYLETYIEFGIDVYRTNIDNVSNQPTLHVTNYTRESSRYLHVHNALNNVAVIEN